MFSACFGGGNNSEPCTRKSYAATNWEIRQLRLERFPMTRETERYFTHIWKIIAFPIRSIYKANL